MPLNKQIYSKKRREANELVYQNVRHHTLHMWGKVVPWFSEVNRNKNWSSVEIFSLINLNLKATSKNTRTKSEKRY